MPDATIQLCVTSRNNATLACGVSDRRTITLHTFACPAPSRFAQEIAMQSFTLMVRRYAARQCQRSGYAHLPDTRIPVTAGAVCESAFDTRMRHRLERALVDGVLRRKPHIHPGRCRRSERWQTLCLSPPRTRARSPGTGKEGSGAYGCNHRGERIVEHDPARRDTVVTLSPVSTRAASVCESASVASVSGSPTDTPRMFMCVCRRCVSTWIPMKHSNKRIVTTGRW